MNADEICTQLKKLSIFRGVYARDNLPKKFRRPAAFVVNTDSKSERGEHWVAIFVDKSGLEYFDPLGFPPLHKLLLKFIKLNSRKRFHYNCKTIQNPESTLCGKYCIAFIRHKAKNGKFKSFISMFSKNTLNNDKLVVKLWKIMKIK